MYTSIETLRERDKIIRKIRNFFYSKDYLEVETPILAHHASVDLHLDSFSTQYEVNENPEKALYLQTSPEFHMKRLLANGSGNIFQITKAFRNGEFGNKHNPEFSILEWYHVDVTYTELMDEVAELIYEISPDINEIKKIKYNDTFEQFLKCSSDDFTKLKNKAINLDERLGHELTELNEIQDFLFTHCIEPKLKEFGAVFVYDYPSSQAALAKVKEDGTACRFELYIDGIELCNGFEELIDANEQEERFKEDQNLRSKHSKKQYPYDKNLIDALKTGLPNVSGVAVGLDRIIMLLLEKKTIKQIMSFPYDIA